LVKPARAVRASQLHAFLYGFHGIDDPQTVKIINHVKDHYPNATKSAEHLYRMVSDGSVDSALGLTSGYAINLITRESGLKNTIPRVVYTYDYEIGRDPELKNKNLKRKVKKFEKAIKSRYGIPTKDEKLRSLSHILINLEDLAEAMDSFFDNHGKMRMFAAQLLDQRDLFFKRQQYVQTAHKYNVSEGLRFIPDTLFVMETM